MTSNLVIPEYVTDSPPNGMGFARADVERVVEQWNVSQDSRLENILLRVLAKHYEEWSDLVALEVASNERVVFACRISHRLLDSKMPKNVDPLGLLKAFAERFDVAYSAGAYKGKVFRDAFFDERFVRITGSVDDIEVAIISNTVKSRSPSGPSSASA